MASASAVRTAITENVAFAAMLGDLTSEAKPFYGHDGLGLEESGESAAIRAQLHTWSCPVQEDHSMKGPMNMIRSQVMQSLPPDPRADRPKKGQTGRALMLDAINRDSSESIGAKHELWWLLYELGANFISKKCRYETYDLLDDIFLDCLRDAHKWLSTPGVLLEDFLWTKIENRVRNLTRPTKGKPVVETHDDRAGDFEAPDSELLTRESMQVCDAVVNSLSEPERSCLVDHCIHGLTLEDIAKCRGLSFAQVRRIVARAKDQLERRLRARGYGEVIPVIGALLILIAPASARESRLNRLAAAGDALLAGEPFPDGSLVPNVVNLMRQSTRVQRAPLPVSARAIWASLVIAPALCAVTFLYSRPAALPAHVEDDVKNGQLSDSSPPASSPMDDRVTPAFPKYPVAGQVHRTTLVPYGIVVDFAWVPLPANDGLWVACTEFSQGDLKKTGFLTAPESQIPESMTGDDLPAVKMSAGEVVDVLNKMSQATGLPLRLMTMVEFDFASDMDAYGYVRDRTVDYLTMNEEGKLSPVRSALPNRLGIYNMPGNVMDFVTEGPGMFVSCNGRWNTRVDSDFSRFIVPSAEWRSSGTGFRLSFKPVE